MDLRNQNSIGNYLQVKFKIHRLEEPGTPINVKQLVPVEQVIMTIILFILIIILIILIIFIGTPISVIHITIIIVILIKFNLKS